MNKFQEINKWENLQYMTDIALEKHKHVYSNMSKTDRRNSNEYKDEKYSTL